MRPTCSARSRLCALLLAGLLSLAASACGEEEDPCPASGYAIDGIQGIVLSPNCSSAVSGATVTLLHGSGASLARASGGDGSFVFTAAELAEGRWRVTVSKGPFSSAPQEVELVGGRSAYLVFTLQ